MIVLSLEQIDGFLPNLDHLCILQSHELSRSLVHKVQGHGLIMYAKIACERILIIELTDGLLFNSGYLAEPMN